MPAIFKTFGIGDERMQLVAVELLSQIDGPMSSFCLLAMAMEKPSKEVRDRAGRALARRDPRDVIGLLIGLVRKSFKYEIKPGNGPGTIGVLFVEGERFDLRRLYRFPDLSPQNSPIDVAGLAGTELMLLTPSSGGNSPVQQKFAAMSNQIARDFFASVLMGEALRRDAVVQRDSARTDRLKTVKNAMNAQTEQTASVEHFPSWRR